MIYIVNEDEKVIDMFQNVKTSTVLPLFEGNIKRLYSLGGMYCPITYNDEGEFLKKANKVKDLDKLIAYLKKGCYIKITGG